MPSLPSKKIETFLNPHKNRPYEIEFECAEFTCVCPKTGQPDFATLYLRYIPKNLCIELKSLKLYLWSYRNEGLFHEAATNQILDEHATHASWKLKPVSILGAELKPQCVQIMVLKKKTGCIRPWLYFGYDSCKSSN